MLLTAVLVLSCAAGLLNLSFTSDFRTYFSDQNPQLRAFEAMEKRFSRQDNLYFLVSTKNNSLFTAKGLALIEDLTERSWRLPYIQRVDSIQNFQFTDVDGDELLIDDFYRTDDLPDDSSALEQLKTKALADGDILYKLLSPDGRVTGINLTLNLPENNSSSSSREAVASGRALLEQLRPDYPDFDIKLGGSATSNVTMGEAIAQDISSLLIISFVVMLVIMLLLLRTLSGVILVTALIAMSVIITMGIFGWLGYTLTPPTGFVPTAIMTIAVADTIHILVSYYFYLRGGEDKFTALQQALKINSAPVFITSITTMVGVLALNTSDSPPYRDMGNMIAAGVMIAWFLTVTFLPAILALLPAPEKHQSKGQHLWVDTLADTVIQHHKLLFIVMISLVAASASLAHKNIITERWHEFFDESFEVRRTIDHIDSSLEGLHVLFFVADSQKNDGINNPEFLQQLDTFASWLREQPEIVYVTALSDTLKRLNQNLHEGAPAWYRIPDSQEAAAQYLLLYELSLPMGLGLETTLTSDRSATRLSASLRRTDSATIRALEQKAALWAQANTPLLNINETTGLDVVFANLTHRNVEA
ncbi:MAG: MMPL family transporter, partial [Thalassolituus sp.]